MSSTSHTNISHSNARNSTDSNIQTQSQRAVSKVVESNSMQPEQCSMELDVELVVPVHNNEANIVSNIRRLSHYLENNLNCSYQLTLVDNASTDETLQLARDLATAFPNIEVISMQRYSPDLAVRQAWLSSKAKVVAYIDIDLSVNLDAINKLVEPLLSNSADIAIGSRHVEQSTVACNKSRTTLSRTYNFLLRKMLRVGFSDSRCALKAMRKDQALQLLPQTNSEAWFFDTELLVHAERCGKRILEVPVKWSQTTPLKTLPVAAAQIKGVSKLLPRFVRFSMVGITCTVTYIALFCLLRTFTDAQLANLIAVCVTTITNTAANQRFTFGIRKSANPLRTHAEGLLTFISTLAITSGGLALFHSVHQPEPFLDLIAVCTANLLATAFRYVLYRIWIFHPKRHKVSHSSNTQNVISLNRVGSAQRGR